MTDIQILENTTNIIVQQEDQNNSSDSNSNTISNRSNIDNESSTTNSTTCSTTSSTTSSITCSICLEIIQQQHQSEQTEQLDSEILTTNCNHTFHRECIIQCCNDGSMRDNPICPNCRTELDIEALVGISPNNQTNNIALNSFRRRWKETHIKYLSTSAILIQNTAYIIPIICWEYLLNHGCSNYVNWWYMWVGIVNLLVQIYTYSYMNQIRGINVEEITNSEMAILQKKTKIVLNIGGGNTTIHLIYMFLLLGMVIDDHNDICKISNIYKSEYWILLSNPFTLYYVMLTLYTKAFRRVLMRRDNHYLQII